MALTEEQSKRIFGLHAGICRTLANPKRLEILSLLCEGELSVGELAKLMAVSLPNTSQHLGILRDRGVVMPRREGVNVFYRVTDPRIIQACNLMRDVLLEQLTRSGQLAEIVQEEG